MERIVQEFFSKPNRDFQFQKKRHGSSTIFHCRGALSLGSYASLEQFGKEIRKTTAKRIVLDLREVVHIDSLGIGTLAALFKDARRSKVELVLVPSSEVRQSLETVGLAKVFPSFDSLDEASKR